MTCPHCRKETPATVPYCQHCGIALDLTYDKVARSFTDEAALRAERETEARCAVWLAAAVAALLAVLAARWLLIPAPPDYAVLPPIIVAQPGGAAEIEPLPLEEPEIVVPE